MMHEINIPAYLNPNSIEALLNQVNEIEKSEIRFVLLKGSSGIFCKGLDLKWVVAHADKSFTKEMHTYASFLKKLQTASFISIALVDGAASGGGMGMVCAADYVIATPAATFSLPEGLLGLVPGMIMPALLNKLAPSHVRKMMFTGQNYAADTAEKWALVDEICGPDQVEQTLLNVMNSMKSCKKEAVGILKTMLYQTHALTKDDATKQGIDILSARLKHPEILDRLSAIADFMD
ncbi:MAG: enoyl-CoA hydratase/isomerase family protein [Bacteroidetes bacterium]|nr:enoyl-CoA hydratase/isomerase family protein [Bacteroidota bacterium]